MVDFDVVVIGGGTGNKVAAAAAAAGHEVALVEPGPLGGTCLNRGCNPTKMLIHRADVANRVREASRFGVDARCEGADFAGIVREVHETLGAIADGMETRFAAMENLTRFRSEARFVDERTIAVDDETYTAEKVVVATGSRPVVPPVDGIDDVDLLTSADAIRLEAPPDRLVVLGGGYIAAELGHFFSSFGTDVTVVEMMDTLLPREDPDVASAFTDLARARWEVLTGYRATAVERSDEGVTVHAETESGDTVAATGDELLVAAGRRPNTDTVAAAAGGIETDDRGFVVTDEYLATSAENVWAVGDVVGHGPHLFKHAADYEVAVAIDNVLGQSRRALDYTAMGHAVFTDPQIGGVGATESELREAGTDYVVGRASFADTAMGRAKGLEHGFAKVLAAPDGEILGCHVLGYEASTLVHEAILAMRLGGTVQDVADAVYVHPSLSKVVWKAFRDAAEKL